MMIASEIPSLPFHPSWSFESLHNKGTTLLFSPLFWSTTGNNIEKEDNETKEEDDERKEEEEEGFEICINLFKNSHPSDHVITLPKKKKVTFDYIQIREYERILGDHPDTKMGPPLSLGWNYKECSRIDLGQYEGFKHQLQSLSRQRRQQQQQQQNQSKQFLRPLSHRTRQRLLVSNGVTEEDIRLVEETIQQISQQRLESRRITPRKERWELLRELRFHPFSSSSRSCKTMNVRHDLKSS